MPSIISEVVFSEPSGRPTSLVQFAGSLAFVALYVYTGVLNDVASEWLLVMATGTGLSGVAEALPKGRRRLAGLVRTAAMLVFAGLIVTIALSPEFIVGDR
jgi:hypothetical protein